MVPKKRFKSASAEDVNKLRAQHTEKTTDRQTKWAVKILKDKEYEDHFDQLCSNKNSNLDEEKSELDKEKIELDDEKSGLDVEILDSPQEREMFQNIFQAGNSVELDAIAPKKTFKFEPDPMAPKKRFKSATAEDVNKLRAQNTEKATDRQTKWAVKILKEWMLEVGHTTEFERLEAAEIDTLLQRFYPSVRTKDGKEYSKAALVGVRAGLNRYLTTPPFSRNMNLMNDRYFMASNQVFLGLINSLKMEGKDISQHKEPISNEDLNRLYESGVFSSNRPKTLQNKVLFDIISHFGRRGKDGLRNLKKDSFKIKVDGTGRKYIKMAYEETDKTHHGLNRRKTQKRHRMYENQGEFCPVRSFEKYLSKLNPTLPDLFQQPLKKVSENTPMWYVNKKLGVNTLSSFMSTISSRANLSRKYTNNCICAHTRDKHPPHTELF